LGNFGCSVCWYVMHRKLRGNVNLIFRMDYRIGSTMERRRSHYGYQVSCSITTHHQRQDQHDFDPSIFTSCTYHHTLTFQIIDFQTRAYLPAESTPTKDQNTVRYRQQSQSPSASPYSSTPNRLFAPRQESPLKQHSTSLVSSQLGNSLGPPGGGDDFVMVDRSEREWVDNIRKSVRGKGGTLGR
jgi:hypothetical protein